MKFVFVDEDRNTGVVVEADNKHIAIEKYVNDSNMDMSGFYYGLDDGQIFIVKITKEL